MQVIGDFVGGLIKVLKITGADMLYRYPYRTSAEAMRADWSKIGQDITSVIGTLESEVSHEQRK